MSYNVAVKVESLSKCYQIYSNPQDRLKQYLYPRIQKMFYAEVNQYFEEFWALKNISFEIQKGETVGIIGTNGSGKSTLLQMICGTLSSTAGQIKVHGRIAALLELGAGFNPEFSGHENVYMYATILGLSKEEINDRYEEIVSFADIGAFIQQPVKTYSSGMVVRLAFAVAINVEPQILVVDEALAVGDELFQRKCFAKIESIKQKGATILFVSHSGSTIVELCDRAILIDKGEMLIAGKPKTVVGIYQKLVYSTGKASADLRNSLLHNDLLEVTTKLHKNSKESKIDLDVREDIQKEFFDSQLKPKSGIEYQSLGARISSPEIMTLSGEPVNNLIRGEIYTFNYIVKAEDVIEYVRFGMLIKTLSGVELGGGTSAVNRSDAIRKLDKNSRISVQFQFVCNLNPGVYFLNAGVVGGEQDSFLHRILDFSMFKVMPIENNTSTVIVDFQCKAKINYLE